MKSSPIILALETSCDETAVAILRGPELLASEISSQTDLHALYGGVVPEVASRNHLLHAPRLLASATARAGVSLDQVELFAATSGPGLATSLMIGASIAKGLALGCGKPYLAINHLEGHLLSPFFGDSSPGGRPSVVAGFVNHEKLAMTEHRTPVSPNVSLVVSGGHTLLVEVREVAAYRILGRTVDDAAGEAFDKVAKMLGLPYPGGPEIERRARAGDAKRFEFPRSMLDSGDDNFSFSGLKTAVRYLIAKLPKTNGALDERVIDDVCASFQAAVVEVLARKTVSAACALGKWLVTLSGGVSCNQELQRQLRAACEDAGLRFLAAPASLSTDNAAMIAFAASLRFARGFSSSVTEEIDPNLQLT